MARDDASIPDEVNDVGTNSILLRENDMTNAIIRMNRLKV